MFRISIEEIYNRTRVLSFDLNFEICILFFNICCMYTTSITNMYNNYRTKANFQDLYDTSSDICIYIHSFDTADNSYNLNTAQLNMLKEKLFPKFKTLLKPRVHGSVAIKMLSYCTRLLLY